MNLSIGRGHPFYLDGIHEALVRRGAVSLIRKHTDVFEECAGVARLGWSTARWLYHAASSGGTVGRVYERLRSEADYNRSSLSLNMLGRQLREKFGPGTNPVVVSHPLLVGILAGRVNLIYQHGELVAPRESLVRGATLVCVPTTAVADQFLQAGYARQQLLVSGLCIEPPIVRSASDMYGRRLARLEGTAELCGGFFSSGAEPSRHIEYIVASAHTVAQNGGKAVIVAAEGGRFAAMCQQRFDETNTPLQTISTESELPRELAGATMIRYSSRRELNTLTALIFEKLDYFVSPAHERVNWAMGLGLPMIALEPTTGPFAPLNLRLACSSNVAVKSSEFGISSNFQWNLERLRRDGSLARMANSGWGKLPITGFDTIAAELIARFS